MVASKKYNISTQKLFSSQLKKALLYAFLEAKKQGTNIVDSQLLLFGLLKANDTSVNRLLQQIYKSRSSSFNPTEKLLNKVRLNFQIKVNSVTFTTDSTHPNFSRPVKRLLFFLLRNSKTQQTCLLTTLHVFTYLLRQKYVVKLIKEALSTV